MRYICCCSVFVVILFVDYIGRSFVLFVSANHEAQLCAEDIYMQVS